jgi:hypothetical protein
VSTLQLTVRDLTVKNRLLAAELNMAKMNYTLMADQAVLVESECKNTTDGMREVLDECVESMRLQSVACDRFCYCKTSFSLSFAVAKKLCYSCDGVNVEVLQLHFRSNASLESALSNATATLAAAQFQLELQSIEISNLKKRAECYKTQRDKFMHSVELLNTTLNNMHASGVPADDESRDNSQLQLNLSLIEVN